MKILHIINGEFYAGAERVQDYIFKDLYSQPDFDLYVAIYKKGKYQERSEVRNTVPMKYFGNSKLKDLLSVIKCYSPQIIHCHSPLTLFWATIGNSISRCNGRLVYHVHSPVLEDTENWLKNRIKFCIEKFCIAFAKPYVIGVSESVVERSGYLGNSVVVIDNGVPVFNELPLVKEHKKIRLGFAGLIRPRKGFDILVSALGCLNESNLKKLELNVYGEFENEHHRQEVHDLIKHYKIQSSINFFGFKKDIQKELSANEIFIIPSLYGEGLPMVLLEAMSVGQIIIASNVGGISEIIDNNKDGFLFEPGDYSKLSYLIKAVCSDFNSYKFVSNSAIKKQRKLYSTDIMNFKIRSLYQKISCKN